MTFTANIYSEITVETGKPLKSVHYITSTVKLGIKDTVPKIHEQRAKKTKELNEKKCGH